MSATPSGLTAPPLAGRPCLVCGTPIEVKVTEWSARCPSCGTWRSTLEPEIESEALQQEIDTDARAVGLKKLREGNNERILDEIATLRPLEAASLFDVGSAHGWFLAAASARGMEAEGIEPEAGMADHARAHGLSVRSGYFPAAVSADERADVISFNDVLEHIPDVDATLEACAQTLRPGGILSVNIPNATGLAYRMASSLARIGVRGPYLRCWQHGLPSPHTHYFPAEALIRVIQRHGLVVRRTVPLSSVQRDGLWARLHMVGRPTPLTIVSFAVLWLAAPLFNRPGNSDIVLVLAQAPAETQPR
ncbi:MAG: methyltransferase protein [Solirubrobacterales bacterium]|nr:methyltransferase protein [Solirubrobacterales bacterium]